MRLGYAGTGSLIDYYRNSFNEAEAHAPRIPTRCAHDRHPTPGFNEAEAHAPRIRHSVRDILPALSGFNEAEAHAPRILRSRPAAKSGPEALQ